MPEDTDKDIFQGWGCFLDLIDGIPGLLNYQPGELFSLLDVATDKVDSISEDISADRGESALQDCKDLSGFIASYGQYPALHQPFDFFRGTDCDDPALVDKADPVAAFCLIEIGGGKKY